MANPKFFPSDPYGALDHIVEECSEVILAASKMRRFGWQSVNPLLQEEEQVSNVQHLLSEISDLRGAISRFVALSVREGYINLEDIND